MPPSVDFAEWVTPNLDVTLSGVGYSIPPPSVAAAKVIVALAVLSEHRLGLVKGDPDPDIVAIAEAQETPMSVLTLGQPVVDAMETAGVDSATIDRVGYYSLHFWARGKAQADLLATLMWSPDVEAADAGPKARRPTRSGRSTGSGSRTRTASSRTTTPRPV